MTHNYNRLARMLTDHMQDGGFEPLECLLAGLVAEHGFRWATKQGAYRLFELMISQIGNSDTIMLMKAIPQLQGFPELTSYNLRGLPRLSLYTGNDDIRLKNR